MRLLTIAGLFILFSAHTCSPKQVKLSELLFKHWVHSFEDDSAGVKAYRPADFPFPPARGREGFEIKNNGELIQHTIAPADGLEAQNGKWKTLGENKIQVEMGAPTPQTYTIEIISVDKNLLKIKK